MTEKDAGGVVETESVERTAEMPRAIDKAKAVLRRGEALDEFIVELFDEIPETWLALLMRELAHAGRRRGVWFMASKFLREHGL